VTTVAIANAVRGRFKTLVQDATAGLLVVYDNHRNDDVPSTGRWVRFSVLFGETRIASVAQAGGRRYRTTGIAIAEVYEPIGKGESAQLPIADTITIAFRGVTLTSPQIIFDAPTLTAGSRDGPWWKRNVQIPFRADEVA
jgi:hypothetical protein